jgi:hypothetical protein
LDGEDFKVEEERILDLEVDASEAMRRFVHGAGKSMCT